MTDDNRDTAAQRPVTYDDAWRLYGPGRHAARERYDELSMRDTLARAYAKLRASGRYDPAKHGAGDKEPLSRDEHLELLATAEYLARAYKPASEVDHALRAGATWGRWLTPSALTRPWPAWNTGPGLTASTTCSPGPMAALA